MTRRVRLHADRMFIETANSLLEQMTDKKYESGNIALASLIIISCATAIESCINQLFKHKINGTTFSNYDDLRLKSKIETILELSNTEVHWGEEPLQSCAEIIKLRNWLVHFKESNIGLAGANFTWIPDPTRGKKAHPTIDPFLSLSKQNCSNLYHQTIQLMNFLSSKVYSAPKWSDYTPNDKSTFLEY